MSEQDFQHLKLLADVESLLADLRQWADDAPAWKPAQPCQILVRRLLARTDALRVRLDAPLIVATLGGTGTGKSTLVNALVGSDVTTTGRQRPTTRQPVMICNSDIEPEELGIDPSLVEVVHADLPALRELVLIDCPDPDTTEGDEGDQSNLARLRSILPHCDVLLVTSTQQKYRSARVADELATAAIGARLVFVQTHADVNEDIRADWRGQLDPQYATGEMYFIDTLQALDDVQRGRELRGDFAKLSALLTRELAGAASHRIRRANLLDLVAATLAACNERLDEALPSIDQLSDAVAEHRAQLSERLAEQMRSELLTSRRHWENRLLGEVASRWGFSPFSLALRVYQGLGGALSATALMRVRTPAQAALWGTFEGFRRLRQGQQRREAEGAADRAVAWSFDETGLRRAATVLAGHAREAGIPDRSLNLNTLSEEAQAAGERFIASTASQLQQVTAQLADRRVGWFTRFRYELAMLLLAGVLLYRLGKNFFWDAWLAPELGYAAQAQPLFGLDFFAQAAFWLVLWSAVLLFLFSRRLRSGLQAEIQRLAENWRTSPWTTALFQELDTACDQARVYTDTGHRLAARTDDLQRSLALGHLQLGHRRETPAPRKLPASA